MYLYDVSAKISSQKMNFKDFLQLVRVKQWYKNLIVFLALFFSGNLLEFSLLKISILAFLALCFVSSAGYILNDLKDFKADRINPEKKNRPLASGKTGLTAALLSCIIFLTAGLYWSFTLGIFFFYFSLGLFLLSLLYTVLLRQVIFADVLTIATLFVLRAVAGAVVIKVAISPWLVLIPFFLSLFLSLGKRHGEILLLKTKSTSARAVLKAYSLELTNSLMIISTTLLIISYALYSFLSPYNNLLFTLPFALFVIFRFYYFIYGGTQIARHPELLVKDTPIIIGILLWVIITGVLIYV